MEIKNIIVDYIAKHSRTPKFDFHDYLPKDIREIFGLPRI